MIKQADVYEGAVVTIPANGEALIDNVNSLDDGTRPVSSANLGRFIASEQNRYFCEYIKQTVNICVY